MNYEISLWGTKSIVDKSGSTILNEYTLEIKYAVLGRHDSTSPIAAYNPLLTLNINGQKSLTFLMASKYYNRASQKYEDNPYTTRPTESTAPILVNGRTIKFKTDDDFYTFVIDDISKDSTSGIYTYTCSDINIAQLSKTGYDIILDTELENNMGTIFELADSVVEDIDWHIVGTEGHYLSNGTKIESDLIHAYLNEALYVYTLTNSVNATNILTLEIITISAGSTIFISANTYEKDNSSLIIIYRADGEYQTNEDRVVINADNYSINNPWSGSTKPILYVSLSYRGRILQNYPIMKYIPNILRTCTAYQDTDTNLYYGYSELEYLTSASISDLISENTNIINIEDWTNALIKVNTTSGLLGKEYVELTFPAAPNNYIYSTTINSCKAAFEATKGFNTKERYVLIYNKLSGYNFTDVKILARSNNATNTDIFSDYYIKDINGLPSGKSYPTGLGTYLKIFLKGKNNLNQTSVLNSYILLILTGSGVVTLDDIKLFPERYDDTGTLIVPNLSKVESSVIRTKNYYFSLDLINDNITSVDDLTYNDILYDNEDNSAYTVIMNNYELITSIEAKESNRFNIILDLCEKFECWSHIYLDYDEIGRVRYKYIKAKPDPIEPGEIVPDPIYVPGKLYFILRSGQIALTWFGDSSYQYTNLDNCFTQATAEHKYQYINRNKYYTKINNTYISANLGHQWTEYKLVDGTYIPTVYYTLSYTTVDGKKTKTWTVATDYSAALQYYILVSKIIDGLTVTDYEAVSVSNDTITNFYTINSDWYTGLYIKRYERYITFNEYTGKDNLAGIKYGINLNSITRTINSDSLVTKLIVGLNSNEFAPNQMCTIAEASLNTSGSSTLYDFNYYITYGLIDEEQYTNDMYGGENGGFNYLGKYTAINNASKTNINLLSELLIATTLLNSQYSLYNNSLSQAQQNYLDTISDILDLSDDIGARWTWQQATTNYLSSTYPDNLNELILARDIYQANIDKYNKLIANMTGEVETLNSRLNLILKELENYTNLKLALDREFYNKYKDYIREGTWISEDYYDPDQYYLDASNILTTSAFPQVSYTFSVADLSDLTGWKDYKFGIGDKTYIRDIEFFKDQGIAQLEVIISAITYNFDLPLNTSITVQNYATRFLDLFQRVAAATQLLLYNEGKYDKAGTLATNSIIGSALVSLMLSENNNIITAADGQFTYDTNGITAIDKNTNYQVRLTTHGLVLTKDGGETWTTGVSAKGINTDILTAGTINADKVLIYGGSRNQRFIWDKYGINAFTGITSSNKNKYVRFDKFGIYGIEGEAYSWLPTSATDLFTNNNIQFSLSWLGMKLASSTTSNYITIRTDSGADKGTVVAYVYKEYTGAFSPTSTYYERDSDQYYFITSDVTRQEGKTYYILTRESTNLYRKIIDAGILSKNNNTIVKTTNFALFEDGSITARNGSFNGVITCQDLLDASGTSMLLNGKIKSLYLDVNMEGIEIDNTHIKLKPRNGLTETTYVEITNSYLEICQGYLKTNLITTQELELNYLTQGYDDSYTQIVFTEDEDGQAYGIVGGHYALDIVGLNDTPELVSGIVISQNSTETLTFDAQSGAYIFASENGVALRHSLYALEVCASGVFVTHQGNRFQLTLNGGGSGSGGSATSVIAIFG